MQRGRGPPDSQRMDPKAAGRRRLVPRGGGARERGGHVRFCISTPRNSEAAIPPSRDSQSVATLRARLLPLSRPALRLPPYPRPIRSSCDALLTPHPLLRTRCPPLCIGVHSIPSVSISRTFLCSALLLRTAPHRIAPHRSALLFPTVSLTFICSLRSASHRS